MTTHQDRDTRRHAIGVNVEISGEESVIQQGRTTNISRGGLCVELDVAVDSGTECTVSMALVFSEDSFSEPLKLNARVVWCTPVDEKFQVGLSFQPNDARKKDIDMFLRFLEPEETA